MLQNIIAPFSHSMDNREKSLTHLCGLSLGWKSPEGKQYFNLGCMELSPCSSITGSNILTVMFTQASTGQINLVCYVALYS